MSDLAATTEPVYEVVSVVLTPDYLKRKLARSPLRAIKELIWNALDADATWIGIRLFRNELGGIDGFRVADDGSGFDRSQAVSSFSKLGQSWKLERRRTEQKRPMHGKKGEGRLFVAALGGDVTWTSRVSRIGQLLECQVIKKGIQEYAISQNLPAITREGFKESSTGTVVTVSQTPEVMTELEAATAVPELLSDLADMLTNYPINIDYDGELVSLEGLLEAPQFRQVQVTLPEDNTVLDLVVAFREWKDEDNPRTIRYCDELGVTLHTESLQRVKSPGLSFVVTLKAKIFRELADQNLLITTCPDFACIHEAVIDCARNFAAERLKERRREARSRWREEEVYPFEGDSAGPFDEMGRQFFDACASAVEKNLDVARQERKNKRFVFRLLRMALDQDPDATCRIVKEVLGLPRTDSDRLLKLLNKTTLSAVIECASTISHRLEFLVALKQLVFSEVGQAEVKEKQHLHRLLDRNCWLFGEQFQLALSEKDIKEALLFHSNHLEPKKTKKAEKVKSPTGRSQRIDMMLNKRNVVGPQKFEHLVVELKRPSVVLTSTELSQILGYALAVAQDPRFNALEIKWDFWIPCVDHDEFVGAQKDQEQRPPGCVYSGKNGVRVWVKTWAEIIAEASYRLEMLKIKLDYDPSVEQAMELLVEQHSEEIPPHVVEKIRGSALDEN